MSICQTFSFKIGNLIKMSSEFVIDASVVVKWLNQDREELTSQAFDILLQAEQQKVFLLAPDLLVHEVFNVLIRAKGLKAKELEEAFAEFWELPLQIFVTDQFISATASSISSQSKISFYDATYVALAFCNQMPLITNNNKDQGLTTGVKTIPLSEWSLS